MEVRLLDPASYRAAADLITDSLLRDPGWVAIGPDHVGHRLFVMRRFHRAALGIAHRRGRPNYGAFEDGVLTGVAATFAAGRFPPPARAFVRYLPAFVSAGPGAIVRGLRATAIEDRAHPADEHVFLWYLAVDPAHQRRGIGRALLARVLEDADGPVYLDTANPANVPYYARFGFEELGSEALPRGGRMWFMRRP